MTVADFNEFILITLKAIIHRKNATILFKIQFFVMRYAIVIPKATKALRIYVGVITQKKCNYLWFSKTSVKYWFKMIKIENQEYMSIITNRTICI